MKNNSPGFSSFRVLLDQWDSVQEDEKIDKIADDENLCFYFSLDDCVFGSTEEGRLMFARMKHPEKEDGDKWVKEADFAGLNLEKAVGGEKSQRLFTHKDLKKIKVMSKEDAFERIKK
jgi:hypothetical protein